MAGNITEYSSPLDTLQPTDRGVDALTQSARQINRIATETAASTQQTVRQAGSDLTGGIKAIGDAAVQYIDYQDKSKVSAAATAGLANIEQAFQLTMKGRGSPGDENYIPPADPNDPTVLRKFTDEHITPFLENLKQIPQGEAGQNYALSKADQIAQHLSTQFHAEAANLAAKGALLRDEATTNSLGALVTATPTFGNMDFALKSQNESIEIAKGGGAVNADAALVLEAHKQQKMEVLVRAGALSAIQRSADPLKTAQEWSDRYSKFIKPGEVIQIAKAANTQMKMDAAYTKQAAVAQKQLDTANANKTVLDTLGKMITPDGKVDTTKQPEMLKDLHTMVFGDPVTGGPPLPGMTKEDFNEVFKFASADAIVKTSDPVIKSELQNRLYAGELTPVDIIKAANAGSLSHADAGVMMGQYKDVTEHPLVDKGFEAAMRGADAKLVIPTNISDFKQEFFSAYRKLDPKDRAAALNFSDQNSLISKMMKTHDPDLGDKMRYQLLKNYGQGIMDDKANAILTAPENLRPFVGHGLEYNEKTKQYWMNGKTYDATGKEVK